MPLKGSPSQRFGTSLRDSPVDLRDLQTLCDDCPHSENFMDEVIGLFLRHAPANYEAMRVSLTYRDGASLSRAAHKLKSQAAYFGARRLVSACQELEHLGRLGQHAHCERLIDDLEDELDRVVAALIPLHGAAEEQASAQTSAQLSR